MYLPPEEWPLSQETAAEVPEEELLNNKFVGLISTSPPALSYQKYIGKSYQFIVNLTARCMKIAENRSFQ